MTLKRRGKLGHMAILVSSSLGAVGDGVRGIWQSRTRHRWLVPLLVFLCATGILLTAAATVEALAPFLYSIF